MQQPIEIETAPTVSASVIWLHGLGADGNDFVPVVPAMPLAGMGLRFIFPHAPVRAVTVNGGMAMRAWYDILAMGNERRINEAHLREAAQQVETLIQRERERGIPRSRIVLIGFSQGGAVAYHCGLTAAQPVAGLALLSTYRVNPAAFPCQSANRSTPVFCAHGSYDDVVPLDLGQRSYRSLLDEGLNPAWHSYPMGHEVCLEEIEALAEWLRSLLGAAA